MIKSIKTRFRAYQLGSAGSSFSYFADERFVLIEARLTDLSYSNVVLELQACGKTQIDTLHITGWDQDHCAVTDLEWILEEFRPKKIEYPGYEPHSDTAKKCLAIITRYKELRVVKQLNTKLIRVDPPYISSLEDAAEIGYKNIFYHPREIDPQSSNNNSTVKLFRRGCFNVASLGDIESPHIGSMLRRSKTFANELDVLILAHHGSDCGVTTKKFLDMVKPGVAICSSNYDNQYDHPTQNVRDLLYELGIPIYTTKTGDVTIESIGDHTTNYRVKNLIADSTKLSSHRDLASRKSAYLKMNADTIRARARPGFKGMVRR